MNQNIKQVTLPLPEWLVNLTGQNIQRISDEQDVHASYQNMNDMPDNEPEAEESEHEHIIVLVPILEKTFELCENLPGVWIYSVDGIPKRMEVELHQVPVYGLFMPLNTPHVVQRLPKSY